MAGDGRLERYRLNAERCLELAQTFTDLESKRSLIGMANAWLKLAEQYFKNGEYEPLSPPDVRFRIR